mmetsp:Transcript_12372/g.13576  ORF Transcript_12372/g.13576 Transcript_12372/m.13576 type:complete len:506 (+) Transcript_12372:110-1627(+)
MMEAGCSDILTSMTGGFFQQFFPAVREGFPSFNGSFFTDEEKGRKRKASDSSDRPVAVSGGCQTPTLRAPRNRGSSGKRDDSDEDKADERPAKRRRGEHTAVPVPIPDLSQSSTDPQLQSDFLRMVPEEVVGYCLSFLSSVEDRHSLQTTCVQFRRISNSDAMLKDIDLGGDHQTGVNGIIREDDTPFTAATSLTPFARAGNLEAIYMLGMIKSYCHQDVERGIFLLKLASTKGYLRSSYALGLILRDSLREQSCHHLQLAANEGYLPALQELLPAREMKAKYGEPDAEELRRHLDPICLNRLLGRHYLHSTDLQRVNTSHCWNPLCGRWAFKATAMPGVSLQIRMRRPFSFALLHYPDAVAAGRVALPQQRVLTSADATAAAAAIAASAASSPRSSRSRRAMPLAASRASREHASLGRVRPVPAPGEETSNDTFASSPLGETTTTTSTSEAGAEAELSPGNNSMDLRVSRMKMCSRCCRAKYCSKLCQVYDWRSGRHKMECQFL